MTLRQKQSKFARMVGRLIEFIYGLGYEVTLGDAFAKTGHIEGSFHYKKLAIDLNLFRNGRFLKTTAAHKPLGDFWKSMGGTWGGDFKRKDGNHYSLGED